MKREEKSNETPYVVALLCWPVCIYLDFYSKSRLEV